MGNRFTKLQPRNCADYQNYIILPNSKRKFIWRSIISLWLLYQLMTFPYRFAFENFSIGLVVIDIIIDLFFLIDFFVHFLYSFIDKRQKLVRTFKPIFRKYLFGSMVFDILSLYPYYFSSTYSLYFFKVFRFARIFDMLSGTSMMFDELFLKVKNNLNFAISITRIINFAILLSMIGQVFGCLWYFIGDYNYRMYDEGWIRTFLYSETTNTRQDQTTIYITSLYWVFTTLSTLGYGDYYPVV